MQFGEAGPCSQAQYWLQVVIALGVIMNTGLATWLAHRRLLADKRENGHGHNGAQARMMDREKSAGDSEAQRELAERRRN